MAKYTLTELEFEFVLEHLPAFNAVTGENKKHLVNIFALYATKQKSGNCKFFFPRNKNTSYAISVIKFIRERTGCGLKEAKDSYDAETVFDLTSWKINKADLIAILETPPYYNIKIEWI